MSLLFDENLPPRLSTELALAFPGCRHVHDVGLGAGEDHRLWGYAEHEGLAIVTKDADFADLVGLRSAPPKVTCRSRMVTPLVRQRRSDTKCATSHRPATIRWSYGARDR